VVSEAQLRNMPTMLVTAAVFPNVTDCSLKLFKKRFDRFVMLPIERTAARSRIANRTVPSPPRVRPVKFGLPTSMSNQPVS